MKTSESTLSNRISLLLKVSRPGLWLVFVWLYIWPTAGNIKLLTTPVFWFGLLYSTLPLNLLVYGMNDLVDEDTDSQNPRKGNYIYGAKTSKTERHYLPFWIFALNIIPLCFIAGFTGEWIYLGVWFLAAVAINFLYNNKPFQFSRKCPYEVPTMIIGHFLIPLFSCQINGVDLPGPGSWTFNGLLLARSHIWLEFADIECDAKAGKRTFAVRFGPVVSFRTVIVLTLIEALSAWLLLESSILAVFSLFGVVVFWMSATDCGVKEEKVHVSVSQSLVGGALMIYLWLDKVLLK
jgi:4-hydroxybenzoate polyprenyltransferase